MQNTIEFESVVNEGTIRIPEKYKKSLVQGSVVTVLINIQHELPDKTKAGMLSLEDFSGMKLDTRGWKFDREEANERR